MQLSGSADRTFIWGHAASPVTVDTPDAFIIYSGNVGIGTINPLRKLHAVSNDTSLPASFTNAANVGVLIGNTSGQSRGVIETANVTVIPPYNYPLFLQPDGGRVVIGNYVDSNPNAKLAVNGQFVVNGAVGGTNLIIVTNLPGTGTGGTRPLIYNTTSGVITYQTSSLKYKKDVEPFHDDFSKLLKVNLKQFRYKDSNEKDFGYIAEELEQLGLRNLVFYKDNQPDGVMYEKIPLYLLEIIKDQQSQIDQLKERLNKLELKVK